MATASLADAEVRAEPPPRVSREGPRTVIWLAGEQDIGTLALLNESLAAAYALDEADLVIDLSAVSFIDASTVGELVRGRNLLRLRSRELTLRAPSTIARRVIDVFGLASLIDPPSPVRAGPA